MNSRLSDDLERVVTRIMEVREAFPHEHDLLQQIRINIILQHVPIFRRYKNFHPIPEMNDLIAAVRCRVALCDTARLTANLIVNGFIPAARKAGYDV